MSDAFAKCPACSAVYIDSFLKFQTKCPHCGHAASWRAAGLTDEDVRELANEGQRARNCQGVCYTLHHELGYEACKKCPVDAECLEDLMAALRIREPDIPTQYTVDIHRHKNALPEREDGSIDYTDATARMAVHVILDHDDHVLLLKRSQKVGVFKGVWSVVTGYLDEVHKSLLRKAGEEVHEETGYLLTGPDATSEYMAPYTFKTEQPPVEYLIYTVLFHMKERFEPKLDWEHTDARWVPIDTVSTFDLHPHVRFPKEWRTTK